MYWEVVYWEVTLYSEPKTLQNKALFESDGNLWDSCDTVHLITNKRQGSCAWRETLDRIRIGKMNEDDKKLLETRRVSNKEPVSYTHLTLPTILLV